MPELPQTLIGLFALACAYIIADWVKHKGRVRVDDTKVNELTKQTALLTELCENSYGDRKRQKKIWKRVKLIAKKVNALHQNTFPKNKP